jgi:hypothetical protein
LRLRQIGRRLDAASLAREAKWLATEPIWAALVAMCLTRRAVWPGSGPKRAKREAKFARTQVFLAGDPGLTPCGPGAGGQLTLHSPSDSLFHTTPTSIHQGKRLTMDTVYLPLQLAPNNLNQSILPNWSFNLFNVNMGASTNAAIEQEALQTVGSYGKQIGHIAEVLELMVEKLKLLDSEQLSKADKDVLKIFLADSAAVRQIKKAHA